MDFPAQLPQPASGKKTEDSQVKSNQSGQDEKDEDFKLDDVEEKKVRKRRTKAQVFEDKQREKEMKALEQKRKAEEKLQKQQEKQLERQAKEIQRQQKERQRQAKERQKELEKEAKEKERLAKQKQKELEREMKQKEKQAKEREKEAERVAKQQLKQAQRLAKEAQKKAKEAAKQAERVAKEKKANPGQSLTKWLKPAEQASPVKNDRHQKIEAEYTDSIEDEKKEFITSINSKVVLTEQLRERFKNQKMKDQRTVFEPYYATVHIHRSRLQFDRFLIIEERFNDYFDPHQEKDSCKYDDSSVEYEDFCGDFCDERVDQMSAEEQEASFNSAIVPDTYRSQDEMSSLGDSKEHIDVRINQGTEWSFNGSNNYTADKYTLFCCFQEELLPLPLAQPEASNQLAVNLKCQLYREIHGFYGAKDVLVKRLASIAERVPKSCLDTLIRETTTKKGSQRFVKPQIVDFLSEQKEGFAAELEQVKRKRDEDYAAETRGRVSERERQIQRLILEQAGTYYIIDLLQFLRQKGFRMLKRDLIEFINARTGSHWDDIRRRMSKMQLKEKEKINNFIKKEKGEKTEKMENQIMKELKKSDSKEQIFEKVEQKSPSDFKQEKKEQGEYKDDSMQPQK